MRKTGLENRGKELATAITEVLREHGHNEVTVSVARQTTFGRIKAIRGNPQEKNTVMAQFYPGKYVQISIELMRFVNQEEFFRFKDSLLNRMKGLGYTLKGGTVYPEEYYFVEFDY